MLLQKLSEHLLGWHKLGEDQVLLMLGRFLLADTRKGFPAGLRRGQSGPRPGACRQVQETLHLVLFLTWIWSCCAVWPMKRIAFSATATRGRWSEYGGQLVTALIVLLAGGAIGAEPGLSELGQGINAYNSRDFIGAVSHLRTARNVTLLSDYVTYHLAYAQVLTGDVDGALSLLTAYRANPIDSSPLAGKISLLYGRTLLDKRDPEMSAKALKVLQNDYKSLPQPDGDFALGLAYEALGEQPQAALSYEHVFYGYPNTDLAAQSWTAMERLRNGFGKDFPAATASQQLERCENWLAAKEYAKARQEYSVLAESLTGPGERRREGRYRRQRLSGRQLHCRITVSERPARHAPGSGCRAALLPDGSRAQMGGRTTTGDDGGGQETWRTLSGIAVAAEGADRGGQSLSSDERS